MRIVSRKPVRRVGIWWCTRSARVPTKKGGLDTFLHFVRCLYMRINALLCILRRTLHKLPLFVVIIDSYSYHILSYFKHSSGIFSFQLVNLDTFPNSLSSNASTRFLYDLYSYLVVSSAGFFIAFSIFSFHWPLLVCLITSSAYCIWYIVFIFSCFPVFTAYFTCNLLIYCDRRTYLVK